MVFFRINTHLTANSNELVADYQDGKYGFTIDNVFYALGGGGKMKCANYNLNVSQTSETIDISALGFSSANDYFVIINSAIGTAIGPVAQMAITAKTATSFTWVRGSSGASGPSGTAIAQVIYNG